MPGLAASGEVDLNPPHLCWTRLPSQGPGNQGSLPEQHKGAKPARLQGKVLPFLSFSFLGGLTPSCVACLIIYNLASLTRKRQPS